MEVRNAEKSVKGVQKAVTVIETTKNNIVNKKKYASAEEEMQGNKCTQVNKQANTLRLVSATLIRFQHSNRFDLIKAFPNLTIKRLMDLNRN